MSATEELRRLLDERGVEWESGLPTETIVREPNDALYVERPDGRMRVYFRSYLTPEQAIAATLGPCNDSCNCTNSERTSDELLPCPFCGAKAEVWQDKVRTWGLIEHEPDCWLAYDIPRHKQEIPRAEFAAWNRRADA